MLQKKVAILVEFYNNCISVSHELSYLPRNHSYMYYLSTFWSGDQKIAIFAQFLLKLCLRREGVKKPKNVLNRNI